MHKPRWLTKERPLLTVLLIWAVVPALNYLLFRSTGALWARVWVACGATVGVALRARRLRRKTVDQPAGG